MTIGIWSNKSRVEDNVEDAQIPMLSSFILNQPNTNDIYFYVLLLRLIGLLFDTEVASEAKQELFYSKYMPFILNLF
jgi:hypothetical protein